MSLSSVAMMFPSVGIWEHLGWAQDLVDGVAHRIAAVVNAFTIYGAENPDTAAVATSPHSAAVIIALVSCMILGSVPEAATIEILFGYWILNFVYLSALLMTQVLPGIIIQYWFLPNLTFLAICFVVTIIRRLFLVPLCRFPGPKKAAVSNYWMAKQLGNGTLSKTLKELHGKYGSRVVRIGPNEVSVNDVDAIHNIYGGKYQRGSFYEGGKLRDSASIKDTRSNYHHTIWRRIWETALTPSSLRKYAAQTETAVHRLVRVLKKSSGDEVNVTELVDNFALDVAADVTFGEDAGLQDGSGDATFVAAIREYLSWLGYHGTLRNIFQILAYFPESKIVRSFRRGGEALLVKRQKLGTSTNDITSFLLEEDEQTGRQFEAPRQLAANTNLAILMGAATGATITQTLRSLAKNKPVQSKLQSELDAHLKSGGDLSTDSIKNLPYLAGVINEALRLHNPLPTGAHAAISERGCEVNGYKLPPHAQVYVPILTLMTDEKYFPRGEEFVPERWTGEQPELVLDQRAFIPWGYGVHACVGKQLATNEMKVTIAKVVREFEIGVGETNDENKWEAERRDYSIVALGDCMLTFKSRKA